MWQINSSSTLLTDAHNKALNIGHNEQLAILADLSLIHI